MAELAVSTVAASAVTTRVSLTVATPSFTATSWVAPVTSVTPSRRTVWKPSRLTVTEYRPGATSGNRKRPLSSVTEVRAPPISEGLETSTLAPGTAAPESSVTVPVSAAVVLLCAHAPDARSAAQRAIPSVLRNRLVIFPASFFAFGSPKKVRGIATLARGASARSLPCIRHAFLGGHNSAEGESRQGLRRRGS